MSGAAECASDDVVAGPTCALSTLGEACGADDQCEAGTFCLTVRGTCVASTNGLAGTAAECASNTFPCAPGERGESCDVNTCKTGLVCLDEVCR